MNLTPEEENLINFHTEELDFVLSNQNLIKEWIITVIETEEKQLHFINYIFCSDDYLHKINSQFLQHDTYTDIITFPYTIVPIEADIFISIQRVKENAKKYAVSFDLELYRVMIHGVLHLLGYDDKSKDKKSIMTRKEDEYLTSLHVQMS